MKDKYLGIQWLRAAAALLVVADHCIYILLDKGGYSAADTNFAAYLGIVGVKIFFVISGAVMVQSSQDWFGRGATASGRFLLRRFIRIIPLYWGATSVYAAKELVVGNAVTLEQYLKSLFFIPYLNSDYLTQPIYPLGWTLNCEMYFYLIFAAALAIQMRTAFLLMLIWFGTTVLLGWWLDQPNLDSGSGEVSAFLLSRPIILYFVVGMFLPMAKSWIQEKFHLFISGGIFAGIVGACLGSVVVLGMLGIQLFADNLVFCAVLVMMAFLYRPINANSVVSRIGVALGDASYSIYLIHIFVVSPMGRIYGHLELNYPLAFILAGMVASSLAALAVYRWVEKPLLLFLNNALIRSEKKPI